MCPIDSTTNKHHQFHAIKKKVHSKSRRGCTSRAATRHQACAISTRIVATVRNVEIHFTGDTRIADWLRWAASQSETFSRWQFKTLALSASAARPGEASDCGRHRQRGGSEESGGDADNVELHYGEMVQLLNDWKKSGVSWRLYDRMMNGRHGKKVPDANLVEWRKRKYYIGPYLPAIRLQLTSKRAAPQTDLVYFWRQWATKSRFRRGTLVVASVNRLN